MTRFDCIADRVKALRMFVETGVLAEDEAIAVIAHLCEDARRAHETDGASHDYLEKLKAIGLIVPAPPPPLASVKDPATVTDIKSLARKAT